MTAVLHVSRPVADALPAGLSIAPVEGLEAAQKALKAIGGAS